MKGVIRAFLFALCLTISLTCFANGQSFLEQGIKEFGDENYEEALQYFLKARGADPKSARVAYYIGLTYKAMENYPAAIPYLRDAATLTPRVDDGLVALIDVLYNTGNLREALEWVAIAEKDQVRPAQVQFLKGLILAKEGKTEAAVQSFEAAKKLDSRLTQQAEFQTANAYAQQGRLKEARERLRSTITLDPASSEAQFARDYEKIVTDRIEREKPWRFSVGIGYKYDTNVIAKGSGPIADSISHQEDSALNVNTRISYTAPFSFRTPYSLSFNYALSADRYFGKSYTRADGTTGNLTEYNNMTNQFSIVPGYSFGRFAVSLPVTYGYQSLQGQKGLDFFSDLHWATQTRYLSYTTVTPTLRFLTTEKSFGEVFFSYMRKKYFDTELHPEPFAAEEERSGERLTGGLGWSYLFKETKGIFSLRYSYSQDNTIGRNWVNTENRFGADILYPIVGALRAQGMAEVILVDYTFNNSFFDEKRRDEIYNFSLGLIYGICKNTDIIVQYNRYRNTSNIPLYDYKREIYMAGVEYRF